MLSIYHVDPLVIVPAHVANDPILRFMPSPHQPALYGPLWLEICALLTGLTNQLQLTVLLFKGLGLLTHLLNIALIWLLLDKLFPQHRITGTLLYAWNPLILIELVANGQHEGLVLSLILLAILLHLQRRRWAQVGALILLGLTSSLSFLALMLIPLYAWFLVQSEATSGHTFWEFCWRLGLGIACFLIPLLPLWRGGSTFLAYTSLLDLQHGLNTPLSTISAPVLFIFENFVRLFHLPPTMDPTSSAELLVKMTALLLFGLVYSAQFSHLRRLTGLQATSNGLPLLLKSWQNSMFWALLCIVTPFWPWYTIPVLGLVCLLNYNRSTIALLLLSCSLLFTYPLQRVVPPAQSFYIPALTFGIPLIYILITKSRLIGKDSPS
jgi:hypothetical protein